MTIARRNPFRSERVEQLPFRFVKGWNWERFTRELAAVHWRAAIVGDHGSGKTTLLEQFVARHRGLTGQAVRTVRFDDRSGFVARCVRWYELRQLDRGTLLALDGAEQLSRGEWWLWDRWSRRLAGLLVTTHRPGRLPSVYHCATSPALLGALMEELAAPPPGPGVPVVGELFRETRGNLREALRRCYDRWAALS